jgi:membrane associated rhomboid family serine protease
VGIYDRDYYRPEQRPGPSAYLPRTVVGALIVVNVAVWLIDQFTRTADGGYWLSGHLAAHVGTLFRPWLWWQFLTAGFTHAPGDIGHILGNMLVLFFLGRDVEYRYGPREFLRVYLLMLIFANVAWCIITRLTGGSEFAGIYGASGAIAGVVVLFAFNFPDRTLQLFFVLPVPAWLLGVGMVAYDMYGSIAGRGSHVAYVAHVSGAAFATLYYIRGWHLTGLMGNLPDRVKSLFRPKPRLRVHTPDDEPPPSNLAAEVDKILEKIYSQGEASLTPKERKTLEKASQEYQRKGAGNGGRKT